MSSPNMVVTPSPIIWTPRFTVLFASLLALGLSIASISTQLWLDDVVRAELILIFYTALPLVSSLLITFRVKSLWIRIGGILAFIWSLLMGLHFTIPSVSHLDPHASLAAHLDIATQCAFLGAATCFSASSIPFRRWDIWFFCLLPLIGVVIVGLNVLVAPTDLPTGSFQERMIVTALLYLSVIVWWCRPANWTVQPGATFLAGMLPLLQMLFTGSGYYANDVAFFMTLVILLLFFLLNLRLLQGKQCLFTRKG